MSGAGDKKKAVIVGAGPAGILAAHLLLKQKPGMFDVTVAELRADPRESEQASLRSYSLGLGVRGRTSIKRAGDAVRVCMRMCMCVFCARACVERARTSERAREEERDKHAYADIPFRD